MTQILGWWQRPLCHVNVLWLYFTSLIFLRKRANRHIRGKYTFCIFYLLKQLNINKCSEKQWLFDIIYYLLPDNISHKLPCKVLEDKMLHVYWLIRVINEIHVVQTNKPCILCLMTDIKNLTMFGETIVYFAPSEIWNFVIRKMPDCKTIKWFDSLCWVYWNRLCKDIR